MDFNTEYYKLSNYIYRISGARVEIIGLDGWVAVADYTLESDLSMLFLKDMLFVQGERVPSVDFLELQYAAERIKGLEAKRLMAAKVRDDAMDFIDEINELQSVVGLLNSLETKRLKAVKIRNDVWNLIDEIDEKLERARETYNAYK